MTDLDRVKLLFNDIGAVYTGEANYMPKTNATKKAMDGKAGWTITIGTTTLLFDHKECYVGTMDVQGGFWPRRAAR